MYGKKTNAYVLFFGLPSGIAYKERSKFFYKCTSMTSTTRVAYSHCMWPGLAGWGGWMSCIVLIKCNDVKEWSKN